MDNNKNGLPVQESRENFSSQMGLILSAVGSAVGLGNIWRFSYIAGVNGGGAFLLVYIICIVLVGMPVFIAEVTIGRRSGFSTVSAFKALAPGKAWWIAGLMGVMAAVIILSYYPLVAGWSLGYVFESIFNWDATIADTAGAFTVFSSGIKAPIFAIIALILTALILAGGVSSGIEKWSRILLPALAILLIILVIRSVTLPGAVEGVKFLFVPKLSELSVNGFLDALGHSFYSLSIGMGILITYGSYMKKDADLVNATISVVALDTLVAIMAGLAIFPAVFALGMEPGQGAGLAFITLPGAFAQMPMGQIFSALFFSLLFIAALTSIMSLFQVPLALLEDTFSMSRKKAIGIVIAVLFVLGIPSALSMSSLGFVMPLGMTWFDFMDKLANNVLLPLTALIGTLFVIFCIGANASKEELLAGSKHQSSTIAKLYPFAIKFIAPIAIVLILLNATGVFKLIFGAGN